MHRTFRSLLDDAVGHSEFVIAVNVDIRGFSDFSLRVDSAQTALTVKKVYARLIDEYFSDASFFKPTGDGLLVVLPFEEANLREVVNDTVRGAIEITETFGALCDGDPMINFEIPDRVGIGLARGPACRLVSRRKTLDYSGRVLNLASRLMDLARPSGVVMDGAFGFDLLDEELQSEFKAEKVYLKGISPRDAVSVHLTHEYTQIAGMYKSPLDDVAWETQTLNETLRSIGESNLYQLPMTTMPTDPGEITLTVRHPALRGRARRKHPSLWTTYNDFEFEYKLEAGKPYVVIPFSKIAKKLEQVGVRALWPVVIQVSYPQ